MKEIFNDFTAWFWPFLGNIFTAIGEFASESVSSLSSNKSDIVSVIGYIAFSAIILFLLKKLLDFIVRFFTGVKKGDIINQSKKVFIYGILILLLASFISYNMGTGSCP